MVPLKKIYSSREERANFIALEYKDFLKGKILDVGCGDKYLRKYLPKEVEYIGIDIAEVSPDVFIDLEKEKIPFTNDYFDCVVCTDVLEHLDNIHEIFNELIRVSKKYIIISMPNCYAANFKEIITGKGGTKYYGLPLEKPQDRHKWFFNYEEAKNFIINKTKQNNAKIINIYPLIRKKPLRNFILKLIYGKRYKNIVGLCLWALIKKNGNTNINSSTL